MTKEEMDEAIEWMEYGARSAEEEGGPDSTDGSALRKAAELLKSLRDLCSE